MGAGPSAADEVEEKRRVLGGCSSMVEQQPSKLMTRVRFPSPAPAFAASARLAQPGMTAKAVTPAPAKADERTDRIRRWPKRNLTANKPHCNIGTIGHVDHGKTSLTAAITKVLAETGGATYTAYDQIDKAPEEKARGITISTAHVEYRDQEPALCPCRLPGPCRLCEEHDHRCGADGRRDPGGVGGGRPDAADPRAHSLARQVGVPALVVFLNKVDMVDDPELLELVEMEVRELLPPTSSPATTFRSSGARR